MGKLKAGRLNRRECLRRLPAILGRHAGYLLGQSRSHACYRDGRLGSIGGGADEVMLGILTKMMGLQKAPLRR